MKEADVLVAAGFRVRVVCGTGHSLGVEVDNALLASRPWAVTRVSLGRKWERVPRMLRKRISARLAWGNWIRSPAVVAWAESELIGRLARAAAAEPADLYIGHYLPGLYAAWKAACHYHSAYGFDAEDSHVDELPDTPEHNGRRTARETLERGLLAGAAHLTAASPLIADAYERRYGKRPLTVLNVFPLSEAPIEPVPTSYLLGLGLPSLYWFSQTIGTGRGLEAIIAAMGRMNRAVELHLRGIPAAGYRKQLERNAAECGVAERLVWHPPAISEQMVRLAAGYDLGLALELTDPPNRAICLTNKAFTYLLAGVPVILSRTHAQEWLAEQLGDAGCVIDLTDAAALAKALDAVLSDQPGLVARRAAAWRIGRERFNWDRESEQFLASAWNACRLS